MRLLKLTKQTAQGLNRKRAVLLRIVVAVLLPLLLRGFYVTTFTRAVRALVGQPEQHDVSDDVYEESALLRLRQIDSFLTKIRSTINDVDQKQCDFLIGVVTTGRKYRRHKMNYLTQTVGHVLKEISRAGEGFEGRVQVSICDVAVQNNNRAHQLELQKLSPYARVVRKRVNDTRFGYLTGNILDKERADYAYCLNALVDEFQQCKSIVVLEDDAIITSNLLQDVHYILKRFESKHDDLFLVKLYHPDWLRKVPWIVQAIALGNFLSFGVAGAVYLITTSRRRSFGSFLAWYILVANISLNCLLSLDSSLFMTLRRRLFKGVYLSMTESCCTPAVLFSKRSANLVSEEMAKHQAGKGHAKDHILDNLTKKLGLFAYQTDLNLVKHIGRDSTIADGPVAVELLDG